MDNDIKVLIDMVLKRHKLWPSAQWLSSVFDITEAEATKQLDEYVIKYPIGNGEPINNTIEHEEQKELEPIEVVPIKRRTRGKAIKKPIIEQIETQQPKEELLSEQKKDPKKESFKESLHGIPLLVIKTLIVILTGIAFIRSLFYAIGWFHGDSELLVWIMAFLCVGVAYLLPIVVVMCFRQDKKGLGTLSFIMMIFVIVLSLFFTVQGVYNGRTQAIEDVATKAKTLTFENPEFKGLDVQEKLVLAEIALLNKTFDVTLKQLTKAENDGKPTAGLAWTSGEQIKKIGVLRKSLDSIQQQKKTLSGEVIKDTREDFLSWVSKVLNIDKGLLELILAIIPAIIIDIVMPILMYVVVFL